MLSSAQAAVNVGDIQIGGFFSQGYMKSTHNNFPVDTKDGTADFREMGFNASTNVGSRLRLGGQLFAQTLGKYGDDKVILDWAIADYNFRPEFGVRVGRVKYPRNLQSDALDLDAFARARPRRIGVRIIGRPHEILDADRLAVEHADAIDDERRRDVAMEILARFQLRLDAVLLRVTLVAAVDSREEPH